jgi:hypothetical protein
LVKYKKEPNTKGTKEHKEKTKVRTLFLPLAPFVTFVFNRLFFICSPANTT